MFSHTHRHVQDATATGGLVSIVKDNLQKQVLNSCSSKWTGDFVLIVDDASVRVISKAMGMYELMENKVYLVEQITKKRAPYRKSAPIYFLSPTLESINCLIEDWTPNNARKEPLYADKVFLYFTSAIPDPLFAKLKSCKPLIRRLGALGETNIDFIAAENKAFHFDMESATVFSSLFRPRSAEFAPLANAIADKLVTVCASLNEFPHIRYRASSQVASSIAHLFNEKMNAYVGKNGNWWYHGDTSHNERGRGTILILSRQNDCLSPLIHEFTYQAMVNDLLPIKDDMITVEVPSENGTEKKDALLNDKDELWVEIRGKHIAEVIKLLSARIRDIVNSNSGVANVGKKEKKALTMAQMANALRNLPEYKEVMSKLSQHMHIAHRCMDIFNKSDLLNISDLEQTLAIGLDDNGRGVLLSSMVDKMEQKLRETKDSHARFRLIAIFVISQYGLRSSDKDRLFAAAQLNPAEAKALSNLEKLGFPLIKNSQASRIPRAEKLVKRNVETESEIEYANSRYACDLKGILMETQTGSLSFTDYPSMYPMPDESTYANLSTAGSSTLRKDASKFNSRKKNIGAVKTRMIVFVAGGVCYSELRAAQEVMEKGRQEIFIGSTNFMNPNTFIDDLKVL